jgi:hypothetical protein
MLLRTPNLTYDSAATRDAAWRPQPTPLFAREKREDVHVRARRGAMPIASDAQLGSDAGRARLPATKLAACAHDAPHAIPNGEPRLARRDANPGHAFPRGPRETTGPRSGIDGVAPRVKPEDG